jgi:phenylpyruvate tautomerase PptA (4-oxalocrotonate tautomerase family)
MPFIECHITAGLSEPRKRQLIREIVEEPQRLWADRR